LVDAEARLAADAQKSPAEGVDVRPPPVGEASALSGPTFYTAAQQTAFKNQYCQANWECIQAYEWATSSYGHHAGRGYLTYAAVGSEAREGHRFEEDYWDGSQWQYLADVTVFGGETLGMYGGNTGPLNCNDGNWYFKSELFAGLGPSNDSDTANPTVSLADHVYSGGNGGAQVNCSNGNTQPSYANQCGCGSNTCWEYGLFGGTGGVNSGSPVWVSTTCKGMEACPGDGWGCDNPP
jgi:hypothetical protein